MTQPINAASISSPTKDLTGQLISCERGDAGVDSASAFRVCDKLRRPLSMLIGVNGYRALITRALTLAKRESKLLELVEVGDDGSLQHLNSEAFPAADALAQQLITLLLSFVGEAVTLRLLRDIWPALRVSEATQEDSNDTKR